MKIFHIAVVGFFLMLGTITAQTQPAKSPNEFLPYKLGDKFTPHHLLNSYFEYLASVSGSTMRLEKYGFTYEDRPLQIAIISSPENISRLEEIRTNNLNLAGLGKGSGSEKDPIAIVWISMSVHGNEPSGSEASMLLAYDLATQTNPNIKQYLKNTVVILDPSLNPDGYDRYTHWNRGVSNLEKNTKSESRQHREPWPGGRVNHYYFDLNRDWAWATQQESRQRLIAYHRWLPHVHPDIHEQGVNDPYYFAPAAEPMHELITDWQKDFQTEIGENNARHFDNNGWLYFTKEIFDLFYPSYGDTYPTFNGAIGMTYEQAGGPYGGRAIEMLNGDTLTLENRIKHHYTTCLSTIEVSSKKAAEIVEKFKDYYATTSAKPQGRYKAFVIREVNDQNKVNKLCVLLDRHHIEYGRVGAGLSGVKAFDYSSGKEIRASINPNDLVISAYQPHSVLVQALFEPEPILLDSLTYDITAWALPFAHGLDAYALTERLDPKLPRNTYIAPETRITASPYTWCIHRSSIAELKLISSLMLQGVKVRTAMLPFDLADQHFREGSFVINRADNRTMQYTLDNLIIEEAKAANVKLHPIFSGYSMKGSDLGSENFRLLNTPDVAMVYGDDVDKNAYGYAWYFFEQDLGFPFSAIRIDQVNGNDLDAFNTLILPDGKYKFTDAELEHVKDWVQNGGHLIAMEGAIKPFQDQSGFDVKLKESPKRDSSSHRLAFGSRQRDGLSDGIPGAIIQTKVDHTHPLGFGLPDIYYSLKTSPDIYQIPEDSDTPIQINSGFTSFGFIGSRVKPQLTDTPVVTFQKKGSGYMVFFMDNPIFRGFWEEGKILFGNALFYQTGHNE
ncbi:MAG: zinc carboxypeptidase [Lewinellaceae bacterium]|nr:zinc carboxypeptidase [Saprospiraceae bacterium]MCB9343995.1 zinc carboxypeptidase [Lewinellaceae bacterium]